MFQWKTVIRHFFLHNIKHEGKMLIFRTSLRDYIYTFYWAPFIQGEQKASVHLMITVQKIAKIQ